MKIIRKFLIVKALIIIFVLNVIVIAGITTYFTKKQEAKLVDSLRNKVRSLSRVGARMIGKVLEHAIRSKILTRQDLFDRDYKKIKDPRFIEPRYHSRFDFYTDTSLLRIQDEFLLDPEILYAVAMDQGGYVPTHNSRFQKTPYLPGHPKYKQNPKINRTKRIFRDRVALGIIENNKPGFIQDYLMLNTNKTLWDVSTPILVSGERWGSFRIGVSLEKINAMTADVRQMFIIGGAIMLAIFVILTILILYVMMLSKIRKINTKIERIANGDLTVRTNAKGIDEIGRTLSNINNMTQSLDKILSEVFNSTSIVLKASEEISEGNNNLAARTENQAAALEETAAAMEEMTATVKHNADNANKANQLASKAKSNAVHGGEVLNKSIHAMKEINESSKKITEIINVIDEIAFQTNLLALNAAVEAARAGEKGRGFAVVAVEVRNLAGRSSQAAKEIYNLIQDSNERVEEGSQLVNESGKVFSNIVDDIKSLADFISEVASASKEQYVGIEEVNRAITQMDEMTQKNAALVEEISSASEEMKKRIFELKNKVTFFSVSKDVLSNGEEEEHRIHTFSDDEKITINKEKIYHDKKKRQNEEKKNQDSFFGEDLIDDEDENFGYKENDFEEF